MVRSFDKLLLEHMKRMQAEMGAIRQDTAEIKSRLGGIETGVARVNQVEAEN
jgi:hypothetical protein